MSIKELLNFIIYDYCKKNLKLINIDMLIKGIKCSAHERSAKGFKIIPYFKRLYKYDYINFNKEDTIIKNNSYTLGLIIGSEYTGLCGCDWDNKYFNSFYKNVKKIVGSDYNLEDCNCANGQCLHILNVVPLLKKIIKFNYNFKYGYYSKKVYSTDFHEDEYNRMLKDNEEDPCDENSDDYKYISDEDYEDDEDYEINDEENDEENEENNEENEENELEENEENELEENNEENNEEVNELNNKNDKLDKENDLNYINYIMYGLIFMHGLIFIFFILFILYQKVYLNIKQ